MKRSALMILAAVAVGATAVVVIRATADDGGPPGNTERTLRAAERRTSGAYDCMPPDVQRRFDSAVRRYDARFGEVLDRLPDDTTPSDAERTLGTDRQITRLRARARRILLDYVPGGKRFDRDCYQRATSRYDRRVARGELTR